jgi:uncharacterized protein YndB with AHSA1/START domain
MTSASVPVQPIGPYLEPIRKSVEVPLAPEAAFRVFAETIGSWWPLGGRYSVFGDEAGECGIEPFVGGELYEISRQGERAIWGRVLDWRPGELLRFSWFPGRTEDTAQTVAVTFVATASGTRLDLEHLGWQTLGPQAASIREGYGPGWDAVLAAWVRYAGNSS